ncbi:SGNH/GDSL hydrolase family protein [Dactylosporangium darangshiense]|uniref:SGNH hydrolase-type esterase domain-containing protein n=1 Tax=Dactylosporangium darangshiense TaxID=579108 RepID=A0ABP8DSU5_9ACTN
MRRAAALLIAALALAGCGGGTPAGTPTPPAVRILPLGDSITDGRTVPGAYRTALWKELTGAGARIDFVGSRQSGPADLPDQDNEGHPGLRIDEIDADVTKWVNATDPRFVLIHLGTNDVFQEYELAGAPQRLAKLVEHVQRTAPDADVFVATLIPLQDATAQTRVAAYNAALPDALRALGPKVHLVDMHAAVTVADLADGVHPNEAGYAKMGAAWAAALRPLMPITRPAT